MTQHRDEVRMRHMLDAAQEALLFTDGKQLDDIAGDRILRHALTRVLEIVGEAASRISSETCSAHPEVPWREIVGLRNRLIHGYDQVDLQILWAIVKTDLPPLVDQLRQIIAGNG